MAGQITAIRVQKHKPGRASVFIDGQFAFGLHTIEAAKLSKGQYLSDGDIAAFQVADEEERAHERALHFLSYRPRSAAEVARRLRQKGFSDAATDAVLGRLARSRLVDDEAFARYWIRNREQFNPRGRYGLRYELRQKGVADSVIDALLEGVDEEGNAYRVATQRLARWERTRNIRRMDSATLRRKLTGHLRRRGFGYAIIQEVWERIKGERLAGELDSEEREDTIP